jgi:hypothetical protein
MRYKKVLVCVEKKYLICVRVVGEEKKEKIVKITC